MVYTRGYIHIFRNNFRYLIERARALHAHKSFNNKNKTWSNKKLQIKKKNNRIIIQHEAPCICVGVRI